MRHFVAIAIILCVPRSAFGQSAVATYVVMPWEFKTLAEWSDGALAGANVYGFEWRYDGHGVPNGIVALRVYAVYTEAFRTWVGAGTFADRWYWRRFTPPPVASTSALGAASGTQRYIGADPNRKAFTIGGEVVQGFIAPATHISGTAKEALWRFGVGDLGSPHAVPDRVRYYVVETYAFPPQDAMSTAELILWREWELNDPNSNEPMDDWQLKTFDDVASSSDAAQGLKAEIENGFAEEEWPKYSGFKYAMDNANNGTEWNWNLQVPMPGSAGPVFLNVNPATLGSTLATPNATETGAIIVAMRNAIRVTTLMLVYFAACRRFLSLLMEDKSLVLAELNGEEKED